VISLYALAKRLGVAERLKSQPLLYFFLRDVLGRLEVMLPLEPDFWAFKGLPATEALFLDIGANDGISARSFRKVNPSTPILSIEPNPCHLPALRGLKAGLPAFDYLIVGLGDAPGESRLFTPSYRGRPLTSFASLDPDLALTRAAEQLGLRRPTGALSVVESPVKLVTADSLGLSPAYVKIDVEGHAAAVFRGMKATVERARPIVMSEYVASEWPEMRTSFPGRDYGVEVFDYASATFSPFGSQEPDNVFLVPEEARHALPRP
jgi:FkbM family methyltransferase